MNIIQTFILKSKNDTLDPLSIIIRLFIYAYKPIGTKISITNNKLYLQENGFFQSTVRTINRDSKNDINIIYFPIIFACKYYLSSENREKYKKIFETLLQSFDNMRQTYKGSEIIYNIDQLRTLIESFLQNDNFDPSTLFNSYDSPGGKIKQDIYSHINSIWTERKINVLFGHIEDIKESTSEELTNSLIQSLNGYMNYIDLITYNLILTL
jgi:hypothetical protein